MISFFPFLFIRFSLFFFLLSFRKNNICYIVFRLSLSHPQHQGYDNENLRKKRLKKMENLKAFYVARILLFSYHDSFFSSFALSPPFFLFYFEFSDAKNLTFLNSLQMSFSFLSPNTYFRSFCTFRLLIQNYNCFIKCRRLRD